VVVVYSLLTNVHTSTLSFMTSNDSRFHHDNQADHVTHNQSQLDEEIGSDVPVSHILALFRKLTLEEQSDFYKQLGIRHESEIYRFLGFNVQPEMTMEEVSIA